jgi:hypothetical protein
MGTSQLGGVVYGNPNLNQKSHWGGKILILVLQIG